MLGRARLLPPLLLGLLAASCAGASGAWDPCYHPSPHTHTYGMGARVGFNSDEATEGRAHSIGRAEAWDTNLMDCDGDGVPGDFDGDRESGLGGGFFGYASPWNAACGYGLKLHSGTVTVSDIVFGGRVWFVIGADDRDGPAIDPVTGACSTSGSITPGDPNTDPTADPDDCLSEPHEERGYNLCGAGGDGGYWVILLGAYASEHGGNPSVSNAPTMGTITTT